MPTVEAFSYLSRLYYPNVFFDLFHTDGIVLQLIHLAFAGFGVFLFLREYRLATLPAFFGGAVFMLNPYMTAMLVHGHGSQLMTAAYMPWMLWATMRLIDRGKLPDAGTLALVAGFQLQRSHVQIAYYSWMLTLLLAFCLFFFRRDSSKTTLCSSVSPLLACGGDEGRHKGTFNTLRLFSLLLLALGCGVAMSAAIYLPASKYAAYSVRGMAAQGGASSWEYATLWSMHPLELFTFLLPGAFGFGGVTYWGFMPFPSSSVGAPSVPPFPAAVSNQADKAGVGQLRRRALCLLQNGFVRYIARVGKLAAQGPAGRISQFIILSALHG